MAIVKEKVTEYQNGQYSRSYTQVNIPASVAKSVGEATNVIGEAYAKAMLDKQNHIENMYHRMNDNITFLSNFKDLNSDFSKTVSYFEDKIKNTFDSFYKIDKKNEIVFSNKTMDKINNRILITFLISILVTIIGGVIDNALIYKPAAIMTVISLGMGFLYLAYGFVVYIPSSLKKARIKFEELENEIDKSNLFDLSIELGKIVNFFNSDEQKVKVYNKEISQDEYESNIVNALKEAIKINFSSTLNKNIIDEQTSKYTEFEKIKEEAHKKERIFPKLLKPIIIGVSLIVLILIGVMIFNKAGEINTEKITKNKINNYELYSSKRIQLAMLAIVNLQIPDILKASQHEFFNAFGLYNIKDKINNEQTISSLAKELEINLTTSLWSSMSDNEKKSAIDSLLISQKDLERTFLDDLVYSCYFLNLQIETLKSRYPLDLKPCKSSDVVKIYKQQGGETSIENVNILLTKVK